MVKRCAAVNVEIIVDVVLNHVAGGVHRELGCLGIGRANLAQYSLVATMIGNIDNPVQAIWPRPVRFPFHYSNSTRSFQILPFPSSAFLDVVVPWFTLADQKHATTGILNLFIYLS